MTWPCCIRCSPRPATISPPTSGPTVALRSRTFVSMPPATPASNGRPWSYRASSTNCAPNWPPSTPASPRLAPSCGPAPEQRWWRRPSKHEHQAATAEIDTLRPRHDRLTRQVADNEQRLRRLEHDRDVAAQARERLAEAKAAQAVREAWIAEHPAEIAWPDELQDRIRARTWELGRQALRDEPDHLVNILGHPGHGLPDDRWASIAGRIEAYRERWRLTPDEIGPDHLASRTQAAHWRTIELALPQPAAIELAPPGHRLGTTRPRALSNVAPPVHRTDHRDNRTVRSTRREPRIRDRSGAGTMAWSLAVAPV